MSEFVYFTASEIIEYQFCPRYIYYMNVLNIEQHEDKRFLVNKGRDIHKLKMVNNKSYIRKKIGCIDKYIDVYLSSSIHHLVGIMDEVLTLDDGSMASLDYKFSEYDNKIYKTIKFQQIAYALLIEEFFKKPVNKAYIVFIRSKNLIKEIKITDKDKTKVCKILSDMFDIVLKGIYPEKTKYTNRCKDCTYKNLCYL